MLFRRSRSFDYEKSLRAGLNFRRRISIETVTLAITYFKSFISLAMYEGVKKQSARITRKSLFPEQSKTGNYQPTSPRCRSWQTVVWFLQCLLLINDQLCPSMHPTTPSSEVSQDLDHSRLNLMCLVFRGPGTLPATFFTKLARSPYRFCQ